LKSGGKLNTFTVLIGTFENSVGTVNVTDPGSTWTNTHELDIGYFGEGTLNISGGGTLNNPANPIGPIEVGLSGIGHVSITGTGTITSGDAILGDELGASGNVIIDGANAKWTSSALLNIGNKGTGLLTLLNGGIMQDKTGSIGTDEDGI